jgi:hypothetical protein
VARAAARRRVGAYTAAVATLGLALLVAVAPAAAKVAGQAPGPVLVLGLLVLVAELMPVELDRPDGREAGRDARDSTTMSQPFAFALVLGWGVAAGTVALAASSALADLLGGKGIRKVLFNSAQLALALAAAGGVYRLLGGSRPAGPVELGPFAAAALTFFVVNNVLVEAVHVLASGAPAWDRARRGVGLRAWVAAMLLGMAPVVAVVAERSLGLVPILGLPTAAVYLACRGAIRADRDRARAEAAAAAARAMAAEQARLVKGEQALIRKLQESERLKRDLLATVSHELKTPLTVILGTLGTLSNRGAALGPAERREFVDMAVRQGTRLKELIERLLLAVRGRADRRRARGATAGGRFRDDEGGRPGRRRLPSRPAHRPGTRWPAAGAGGRAGGVAGVGQPGGQRRQVLPRQHPIRLEAARAGRLAVLAVEDAGPGCRPANATASSSGSPSWIRGRPGGRVGWGWGCISPGSWRRRRGVSCWWGSPAAPPVRVPASSCAYPSPTRRPPPPGHPTTTSWTGPRRR